MNFVIASPHTGKKWMDYFVWKALKHAITNLGFKYEARAHNRVYFLGWPLRPSYKDVGTFDKSANNIAIVYGHPDLIKIPVLKDFNHVVITSQCIYNDFKDKISTSFIPPWSHVKPLPSVTKINDVVMVATARPCGRVKWGRPILYDLINNRNHLPFDLKVNGVNWEKPEAQSIITPYASPICIDNDIIDKYYNESKIVLHDSHGGMRRLGMISHKLVDVMMAKVFFICDGNRELLENQSYKGCVIYKDPSDLYDKVCYYLAHQDEAQIITDDIYQRIKNSHSVEYAASHISSLFS